MALYAAVLILAIGLGLLATFLSVRLTLQGFSPKETGLILTAYFIGSVVGTFCCIRVIQRMGHIRSFGTFAALATVMVMLHGTMVSAPAWAILRFITGIATIGLFMVIESWLNQSAPPRSRGRIFSMYMVIYYLGTSAGQQLLNLGNVAEPTLFYVIGLLLVSCIIPVAMTRVKNTGLPEMAAPMALKNIIKQAPLALIGCMTAGLTSSAFYTMGPVFCQKMNFSVAQLSYFMTFTVLGGLVFQWPMGTITDRFDRSLVIPVLGGFFAVVSGLMILASQISFGLFMAAVCLFGGLMFSLYPVAVARAHDMFEKKDVVAVSSALLLFYGIGAVIGPMAASTVIELLDSPHGFFVYLSIASAVPSAISYLLRYKEMTTIIPVADQGDFMILNHTSQIALQIDLQSQGMETKEKMDSIPMGSVPPPSQA